jgi:hypothetical protein
MALSTITRSQARADLRSRLGNITVENIVDDELNYWINLGQIDIAARLSSISAQWYGTVEAGIDASSLVPGGVSTIELVDPEPSEIMRPQFLVGSGSGEIAGKLIPWARIEECYSFVNLGIYVNHVAAAIHGPNLYLFVGENVEIAPGDTVDFFYIAKPATLIGEECDDDTLLDVPDEYVDLVIMYAQGKAYQHLGNISGKQDVDQDVARKLDDVRNAFQSEMRMYQVEQPLGQQSPRMR